MADKKDGKKSLSFSSSPYRILRELFAHSKLSSKPSDDEDKLSSRWRQDKTLSNDSKSEEDETTLTWKTNVTSAKFIFTQRNADKTLVIDKWEDFDLVWIFDYAGADYSSLPKQDPCDSSYGATESVGGGIESVEKDSEADSVQSDHFASERVSSVTLNGPNCTFKLEGKIVETLLKHQLDGLKWLWSLHCQGKGGILGDDMGLGKTRQICCFLAGLLNSRLIKKALVVVPKTLLPHWIKELSAVGLSEKTRGYNGTSKKAREEGLFQHEGVLLTTYGIVRGYSKSLTKHRHLRSYDEKSQDNPKWDYVILDEAHYIKNPKTQRAKSLLEIPCPHRIVVSGTPWQNDLKEMWALFNFCCPGLLGDKEWFEEKFEWPILWGRDRRASKEAKRLASSSAKELRDLIHPFFLSRQKSEVGEVKISNKQDIVVWLRLTNIQRQLYKKCLKSVNYKTIYGAPFAAIEMMKKICDHPLLLFKRNLSGGKYRKLLNLAEADLADSLAMRMKGVGDAYKFKDISCKTSFIMSLLGNLIPQGHYVIIFSGRLKMLDLIQKSLLSEGYKFLRIDGTTKVKDRTKIVSDFQNDVAPIFLLSSKVGGLGLTLTRADRVIVAGPDWNPSTDNQIVDRAYRIGQTKDVVAYRLITCGTFEEKAYRKQVFKDGLCKTAKEHKEQNRYFSRRDLKYLFSLPEKGFDVSVTQQQLERKHDWQKTMDESFKEHIEFLKSLGIAGVSHHSVLFSKEALDEDEPENDKAPRAECGSDLLARKHFLERKSRFRKLDWAGRFAQDSNEWNHSGKQKTFQTKLRNQVDEFKLKSRSQLDVEVNRRDVEISSSTGRKTKHTQCQTRKSNESIIPRLIDRARRLFKIMR
ncbi:protein CHROMATIN REMODELING 24-like [Neltuma alba]|uniref:protein CHROMATIN REMODELING 24-like n=1 Tax=Neltuma alba TaxID=207710 RepID=UPI0010A41346|nr:protein CHROMATIN REMODELING 24-like [Prosopis alba]